MKRVLRPAGLLVAILFTVACATSSQVNPQITGALSQSGVTGGTYSKVNSGETLDFEDILDLVQKGVPVHIIISYLQSTSAVYNFNNAQYAQLKQAGAAPQLLAYLGETDGFYAQTSPAQQARIKKLPPGQRTNSPLYQDEQPFAYNAPEVDYWYDSGYEESTYSPFSFNAD